jgi:uncharacterized protein YndB with AHSA1/START domain
MMETTTSTPKTSTGQELVIERIFNAPRALVWKAWTDPTAFAKWWGPKSYTGTVKKLDTKTGGSYHYGMIAANGKTYWTTGTYIDVSPMDRIEYTDSFADENGNVVSSTYYGMPEMPKQMKVILEFEDLDSGRTKMTLRHSPIPAGTMQDMTKGGWNESFDKLEASIH